MCHGWLQSMVNSKASDKQRSLGYPLLAWQERRWCPVKVVSGEWLSKSKELWITHPASKSKTKPRIFTPNGFGIGTADLEKLTKWLKIWYHMICSNRVIVLWYHMNRSHRFLFIYIFIFLTILIGCIMVRDTLSVQPKCPNDFELSIQTDMQVKYYTNMCV